jgi:hypothetical protein
MGINHFNASFWFGDLSREQVLSSMQLFAEEVLPVIRAVDDVAGGIAAAE